MRLKLSALVGVLLLVAACEGSCRGQAGGTGAEVKGSAEAK
jgi:hypothetical protein